MNEDKIAHKLNIINIKEERLRELEVTEAIKGINCSPETRIEIKNLHKDLIVLNEEVKQLRQIIMGSGVNNDNHITMEDIFKELRELRDIVKSMEQGHQELQINKKKQSIIYRFIIWMRKI